VTARRASTSSRVGDGLAAPLPPRCRGAALRAGARQILNRAAESARVLICSINDLSEVAEQIETGLTVVLTSGYDRLYRDSVDIGG
jgi:hypothetical protein